MAQFVECLWQSFTPIISSQVIVASEQMGIIKEPLVNLSGEVGLLRQSILVRRIIDAHKTVHIGAN
jgi:hypothetical protein